MNVKKIVLGVSAVVAAMALAACSSGTDASGSPQLAAANGSLATSSSAKPAPTTLAPTTTIAPPATTTTAPPVTTTVKPTVKPVAATVAPGIPCTVAVSACVSISEQKAWLVSDGKVIAGPVTVKTGRKGYPTPVGVFHVQYQQKMHISKAFNDAPMPYSTFFTTTGVAFHEGSLSESSHGCVHMARSNAILWFNTLKVGETVQVVR